MWLKSSPPLPAAVFVSVGVEVTHFKCLFIQRVQNTKWISNKLKLLKYSNGKAANLHVWGTGTMKCLVFLLIIIIIIVLFSVNFQLYMYLLLYSLICNRASHFISSYFFRWIYLPLKYSEVQCKVAWKEDIPLKYKYKIIVELNYIPPLSVFIMNYSYSSSNK